MIRDQYLLNYPLAKVTWFQVGGPADFFYKPQSVDDLSCFLKNKPADLPVFCIGAGSNILVRDGGIRGFVIRLGGAFSAIEFDGDVVIAGAGCLDRTLAMQCMEKSLGGLEFLVSIPGTIGGAVAMNAGAYGTEIKDILEWAEIMDEQGAIHRVSAAEIPMGYRHGNLPDRSIVIRAAFRGARKPKDEILRLVNDFLQKREETQPTRGRTGGSTFKNPGDHNGGQKKAWELIDQAGCRGLTLGGAQISEKHCNFLLNLGNATAADIETLGETVRSRVLDVTGVSLEWEVIRLGSNAIFKKD
ncbi:MAG: UDP-N-acetylmuramate dehydrogenase [Alphaproteobacteria bacterium]|nr:UDP-N-acetylmuramate dehydrogenase [Alphaproteobacteria bacterium]